MGGAGWDAEGLYGGLAHWWPLLSPPEEYAEEAAFIGDLLAGHDPPVRDLLELGSGGGHNAVHLSDRFRMTLVDLSPAMLDQSRLLNPACEHHVGDMRTVRLGRTFDAVLVHDAVAYMTTHDDLRALAETAFAHLRPGGLVVLIPDHTTETFEESTDHGGADAPDGRGARYLEWAWDPDPADTEVRGEYIVAVRGADGRVRVVHDRHVWGLFPRADWLAALDAAGFTAWAVPEVTSEDRSPRELFLGRRP